MLNSVMGGILDDWHFISSSTTLVLVGRMGNGKSATGNSLVGSKPFKSLCGLTGVATTCEQQCAMVEDKFVIVIDTPADPEFLDKEILKCVDMAKDGIHAFLMVLSLKNRFSIEEKAVVTSLKKLFGDNVTDHMIVVFTGGDELEEADLPFDDYLRRKAPAPLLEILELCGNRHVVFDNETEDGRKKAEQVKNLLSLVDAVVLKNGGKPYTHDAANKEQMKQTILMAETKLKEATARLEQQLAEEQKASARLERQSAVEQKAESELREANARREQQLAEEELAQEMYFSVFN